VDDIIGYLGLGPHRCKSAMALSGGNRRKLSIGIAIIGSPDVLFLDEPSSGLDPVSRRSLWTCIADLAARRSVILTTHHLEEVDALANRVGIMLHGRLRCLGSVQHLKSKFGDGYTLQFRAPAHRAAELHEHLADRWPTIALREADFGRVVYHLPNVVEGTPVLVSDIFRAIQKVAPVLGIQDYSVSQTSLQDVFLRLTASEADRPTDLDSPSDPEYPYDLANPDDLEGTLLNPLLLGETLRRGADSAAIPGHERLLTTPVPPRPAGNPLRPLIHQSSAPL